MSVKTVLLTFDDVIDTLEYIKNTEISDFKAHSLLDFLLSEKFILTALTFTKIFKILDPITKIFQSPDIDLLGAINSLELAVKDLQKLRCDEEFNALCEEATLLMSNSQYEFTVLPQKRSRKKKKMPGETASDDTIDDPKKKFKTQTYLCTVDAALTAINDRFNSSSQNLLKDISYFSVYRLQKTKTNPSSLPKDVFNAFSDVYNKIIKSEELRDEYIQFSKLYFQFEDAMSANFKFIHKIHVENDTDDSTQETEISDEELQILDNEIEKSKNVGSLLKVFQVCHVSGLGTIFPTLHLALKIACTLPVSSTTPERTFSKLKIVKNRLRTTISQDRLEDLMLMTCESDIPINNEEVTNIFASLSSSLTKRLI